MAVFVAFFNILSGLASDFLEVCDESFDDCSSCILFYGLDAFSDAQPTVDSFL